MGDAIITLAGILAVAVILNHLWGLHVQSQSGRAPVVDTMEVLLFVLSIAVLLAIAAHLRSSDSQIAPSHSEPSIENPISPESPLDSPPSG